MKIKTGIWAFILAGILFPAAGRAQKLSIENGRVVIDCTIMVDGSYTMVKKAQTTTTATDSTLCSDDNSYADIATSASNALPYGKFELAKKDLQLRWRDGNEPDSDPEIGRLYNGMSWAEAIRYCAEIHDEDGKGWRLPTYRELALIGILRPEINELIVGHADLEGFKEAGYWTATESDNKPCWTVKFSHPIILGIADKRKKSKLEKGGGDNVADAPNQIRCIRDL